VVHYRHISQIGNQYKPDPNTGRPGEEGTVGHRQGLGGAIAQRLQEWIAARDAALQRSQNAAELGEKLLHKKEYMELCTKIRELKEKFERQLFVFNNDGSIDWGQSARTVVYDHDPGLQNASRIRFAGGRMYTDDALTAKLDTSRMTTAKSGNGWAIYVMSATGNIHVSSHVVGHRHHSSLLAGRDVAAAGELKVRDGFLDEITNKTGHYQAKLAHFVQVLHQLEKNGVQLGAVTIKHMHFLLGNELVDSYQGIESFSDFLVNNEFETEIGVKAGDYEYAKLLAYLANIPFNEFNLMAAEIGWRWVTDDEYNRGMRGVVRTVGGAPVPHKWVRRWLKGRGRVATNLVQSGQDR
jgi:hypothetical protein